MNKKSKVKGKSIKLNVSMGIITCGDDIYNLLNSVKSQKLDKVNLSEIIVVSTIENRIQIKKIIEQFQSLNILEIYQKKREGKFSAVNEFLKKAKNKNLILCSGDLLLKEDTIEKLCFPLIKDDKIGIVTAKPIPRNLNPKFFLDFLVKITWELHDDISQINPKLGELIAFRKFDVLLDKVGAEEEMIGIILDSKGYKKKYASDSIVYNVGPITLKYYILQRRRNYCCHLVLSKRYEYNASTCNSLSLFKILFRKKYLNYGYLRIIRVLFIELVIRVLGYMDFKAGKEYVMWKIVKKS